MENINRFTVRKQITEHVAGMEFSANGGSGDGLYFYINAVSKGKVRHSSNISPSDVYWCEVDATGHNTGLGPEVIGTCILYVIVHPDIYVDEFRPGSEFKNPAFVVSSEVSRSLFTAFYDETGQASEVWFNHLVPPGREMYAAIFVSSLDDLKMTKSPWFRLRDDTELHPVRFVTAPEVESPADDVLLGLCFAQAKFNGEIVTE